MKTSPHPMFHEETVWHTRKNRQETEKDIHLILNRLKLLKREDKQLQDKIVETKKKTQSLIELKLNHHETLEQKKMSKRNDEQNLKDKQKLNQQQKEKQEEQLDMIKQAMEQIKNQEYKKIKELSIKNAKMIEKQREDFISKNKEKREMIKEVMHKSKSNISLFWSEKLESIQRENEKAKQQNKKESENNKILQERLGMEESYLLQKLQKSNEVQKKLLIKMDRAKNAPHDDFKSVIEEEDQNTILNVKSNKSHNSELPRWLPTPEKDTMNNSQKMETEPISKKGNNQKTEKEEDKDDQD